MKTILTKYLPATSTKPGRYKATDAIDGYSVTVSTDYSLGSEANHVAAAEALCKKMGWTHHNRATGALKKGYCHVFTSRKVNGFENMQTFTLALYFDQNPQAVQNLRDGLGIGSKEIRPSDVEQWLEIALRDAERTVINYGYAEIDRVCLIEGRAAINHMEIAEHLNAGQE